MVMTMMTRLRPTFFALMALAASALTPALVYAQQQQGAQTTGAAGSATPATPVNAAAEEALKQMRDRLRALLVAQEAYYSDNGTYTTNMMVLGRHDPALAPANAIKRRDSVSVQVIFAGGRGWTGVASHWGLRGKSCVVYVGYPEELPKLPITRADRRTPTEEGVPTCDAGPAPGTAPAPQPAPGPQPAATPPARSH
jgi:hypothetical protein